MNPAFVILVVLFTTLLWMLLSAAVFYFRRIHKIEKLKGDVLMVQGIGVRLLTQWVNRNV